MKHKIQLSPGGSKGIEVDYKKYQANHEWWARGIAINRGDTLYADTMEFKVESVTKLAGGILMGICSRRE